MSAPAEPAGQVRQPVRLDGAHVLVVGATGGVGSGVARVLASAGAHVHLSSRDGEAAARLAAELVAAGGAADGYAVDATDPVAVREHVAAVLAQAGRLSGAFCAVGSTPEALGYPAVSDDLAPEVFERPFRLIATSTFLVAREAAAAMARTGGGSVVTLSATLSGGSFGFMAALTATCGAVEAMTRALSGEYAPQGVRVSCVRGDAMPETSTIRATGAGIARLTGRGDDGPAGAPAGPLGRPLTVAETGRAVAFLLSDASTGISGQVLTVSGSPLAGG